MKWRDRNWRAKVAQAETYISTGEYQIQRVVRYLTAGAVAKILFWPSMPWWAVVVFAPPVLAACWLLGYAMNRWGWTKQAQEVTTLERIGVMAWASYWWQDRTAKALGYKLNDIPKDRLPPEIEEIMASAKGGNP